MKKAIFVMMFGLISSMASAMESFTCKNEGGWGTWKYNILSTDPSGTKGFSVTYEGYSLITKTFGKWAGTGWWNTQDGTSYAMFNLDPDQYLVSCTQVGVTNKWECDDNSLNKFSLACYPW